MSMLGKRKRVTNYRQNKKLKKYYKPKQKILNAMGIEYKYRDTEFAAGVNTTLVAAGTGFGPINLIAIGDGNSNRDGRKCTITSVHVKGYLELETNVSGRAATVRIAIVMDRQNNGALTLPSSCFQDPTSSSLDSCAFRNLDQTQRFKVIKDETFTITNQNSYYDTGSSEPQNYRQRLPVNLNAKISEIVSFIGDTAAVTSINSNLISVFVWSDALSNVSIEAALNCRVRFVG